MSQIAEYHRPRTLEEALKLLQQGGGKAVVLAGGTSLGVRLPSRVEVFVDMADLGLDTIEEQDGVVVIGAGTRVADLLSSPVLDRLYGGILPRAARGLASTPLRNRITVGGNAVQVLPWSDLPGVLLAMDASFEICSAGGRSRTLTADEFYARHPRTHLSPAEMVTGIRIPVPRYTHLGAFHKVGRTKVDYAGLTVTTTLQMEQNRVVTCRIVAGALRPLPVRIRQAETTTENQQVSRDLFVRAGAIAAGAVEPTRDFRYSQRYRKHLLKVWTRRCLEDATGRGQGGNHAD
ncbi:MAG: FAD binding domain-containing protein [Pseudomonadota bacterium]